MSSDNLVAAEAKKKEGNDAFAKKEYEAAIGFYSEAIELDPQNHIYYSNRSLCYAESGKFTEALADAEQCVKLEPSFVKGYHRVANAQFEMGQMDAAIATIKTGLQKDTGSKDLTNLLRKIRSKKQAAQAAARRPQGRMDENTQKEVQELSEQYQATGRELSEVNAKLQGAMREQKATAITIGEVDQVTDETPLYRAVGKMFMLSGKDDVKTSLSNEMEDVEKRKTELTSRRTYLQRRLQSQEANLKDLMTSAMG
mmetsp:Transcript_49323/g.139644  ORF Transcript_49323/g.139644 Transcript_49323/m.139644 type:complete len:255 (-) Transcript_49323:360-1124(-)